MMTLALTGGPRTDYHTGDFDPQLAFDLLKGSWPVDMTVASWHGEGTYFLMEVSAKVFDWLKAHTKAEAVPFANGFVCLELIVTGLSW